ncbi:MAG: hypothetical protein ACTSU5_00360 [Promethearchaeota archaeon]
MSLMIKYFLVMFETGEMLFDVSLDDELDPTIVASFVGAVFSFMQNALQTEDLKDIDVGKFRFLVDSEQVGNQAVLFIAIASRDSPITELLPKLYDLKGEFLARFRADLLMFNGNVEKFYTLQDTARAIIRSRKINVDAAIERKILNLFQRLYDTSEFAIGAALLDTDGKVLFSFMEPPILSNIVKILEGRFIAGIKSPLKEILSVEDDGILVLLGGGNIIVAVLFQRGTPLGTAQIKARTILTRFQEIFKDNS